LPVAACKPSEKGHIERQRFRSERRSMGAFAFYARRRGCDGHFGPLARADGLLTTSPGGWIFLHKNGSRRNHFAGSERISRLRSAVHEAHQKISGRASAWYYIGLSASSDSARAAGKISRTKGPTRRLVRLRIIRPVFAVMMVVGLIGGNHSRTERPKEPVRGFFRMLKGIANFAISTGAMFFLGFVAVLPAPVLIHRKCSTQLWVISAEKAGLALSPGGRAQPFRLGMTDCRIPRFLAWTRAT